MKNIIILTISVFLLSACGSNGSKDSNGNTNTTSGIHPDRGDTSMIINQQYVVSEGDQIFKDSDLAKVKIIHSDGNTRSTVELIEGSATLRKN